MANSHTAPGPSPLQARQLAFVGRATTALSPSRLGKFYLHASQPGWEALANYAWNVCLCEAFDPLLHQVEIVVRNAIDGAISPAYPSRPYANIESWLDAPNTPLTSYAKLEV